MNRKLFFSIILAMTIALAGCAGSSGAAQNSNETAQEAQDGETLNEMQTTTPEVDEAPVGETTTPEVDEAPAGETTTPEVGEAPAGDIVILYTNDVHCAIDDQIGYDGLSAYKKKMQDEGNAVFLVDDGDEIQGGSIGTLTKGEAIANLMNEVGYDLSIPGNHDFDYGMERYLDLVKKLKFPVISCNLTDLRGGERVFDPYVIREIGGKRIGFVGVTTPTSITTSTPVYFENEEGEFIYGFKQGSGGKLLYQAVQEAVDAVHEEGVDYTILIAHLGLHDADKPYTSVEVIQNTTGIDAVLDGHSHDLVEMEMVKNKEGREVLLTQAGYHLGAIGKVTIDNSGKIRSELIRDWNEKDRGISEQIERELEDYNEIVDKKVGVTDFKLAATDDNGSWLVRNNETNLGDLVADAYRYATGADIGLVGGGGVRATIKAGEITYNDVLMVNPFSNQMCAVKVKGQTLADALEYSVSYAPSLFGGFLQVSGITFDVDLDKDAQVQRDENGMFMGFGSDERRISNIMVGGEPLDPDKEYTVGSLNYLLLEKGDGYTMFSEENVEQIDLGRYVEDAEAIVEYMDSMGGKVSDKYADVNGEGRIHFLSE